MRLVNLSVCSSCDQVDAFFRDFDLIADHIVCRACSGEGPAQAEVLMGMIKQHEVEVDGQGQMAFWCGGCQAFDAVLRRRGPLLPAGPLNPES